MQRNSRLLAFEEQLALVHGKINHVNMADDFARYRDGLLYYWNRAEELHLGAQIIHDAHGPHDVFSMLAGLSLEVLLKGIHRALDNEIRPTHRLDDLCRKAGISVSSDDQIILACGQPLGEVSPMGKHSDYLVPMPAARPFGAGCLFSQFSIFRSESPISVVRLPMVRAFPA